MMRLASSLLVAVLLTSSVISGTFAKYVTEESGSDSARVAKWGVNIDAESFGMFATDYETDDDTATFTGDYSVSSAAGDRDKVLAPGTSGKFANIAITGTPEVAVDVKITPNVTLFGYWAVTGDTFYCPIVVTVGTEDIFGLNYNTKEEFETAIENTLAFKSNQYAPNTNLATTYDTTNLDLAWRWAFETGANEAEKDLNNKKDTELGNNAVTADLGIEIELTITVTQID